MRNLLASIQRFLTELRRRKVYQVALAYLAASFVVVELADIAAGTFNLPGWFGPMVWVLVGLGFPIALLLAWALEVTPEGVRVDTAEETSAEAAQPPAPAMPSLWVGASVLALVLLFGWWYFGGLSGPGQEAVPEASSLDANRMAVFPFEVRGAAELEYLGESMVELLGRSIDGAGALRTVDPKALLVQLRADDPNERTYREIGPSEARTVAAEFGAGRYVLGSVDRVGAEIHLSATWYGADGEELGTADVVAESEEEIQESIDALARRVIADLAGKEPSRRRRLAALTTSSTKALKAYLEGQSAFRYGNHKAAIGAFERAVEADSSFALAYYRLSVAAGWIGHLKLSHRAARQIADLSEELPERDRRLIRAWRAFLKGRMEEAERLYRLLVNEYPSDSDAWYLLGETLFHFGGTRGRPVSEAQTPFETVLDLDPSANEPLLHLIQLALIDRDQRMVDSLTSGLERRSLGGSYKTAYRAIRAYVLEEGPDSRLEEQLVGAGPLARWYTGYFLQSGERLEGAVHAIRPMADPDRPAQMQAGIRIRTADLLAGQGQLEAAQDRLEAVASLDSAAYLTSRGLLATLPYLPESKKQQDEHRRLLKEISAWDAKAVPERHISTLFLRPSEIYPSVQRYLMGLLRVQLDEPTSALELADRLNTMEAPVFASSGPSDFSRAVEAEVERYRGNSKRALRRVQALEHQVDPVLVLGRFYSGARERFLRAELLAETGRLEEALWWYRTFDGVALGDLPYLGPAHLGRGKVLQELGRPDDAIEAYDRFLELWKNADPALQPMVEEARQRRAGLVEKTADTSSRNESNAQGS